MVALTDYRAVSPPDDDVASFAETPCTSIPDAARRLKAVLEYMGGSMEPTDEPGLPQHRRAIEDVLRSAIRFLTKAA